MLTTITEQDVETYQTQGVVVLRDVFTPWIEMLSQGAAFNISNPSIKALTHGQEQSRFLEDFCCWQDIPQYKQFILESPMAAIAAKLMRSDCAQFFHDHFLYKDGGSNIPTPWHQDMPYYCVDGEQTVSFWIPLECRDKAISLKCLAGSHHWPKAIRPTSWSSLENFYEDDSDFMNMPTIDDNDPNIKVWSMNPGDVVAFNFKTVHCANANTVKQPNRTLSFRLVGDDARFIQRPGRTSPNFPDIKQKNGERLREDWFPVIYHK